MSEKFSCYATGPVDFTVEKYAHDLAKILGYKCIPTYPTQNAAVKSDKRAHTCVRITLEIVSTQEKDRDDE